MPGHHHEGDPTMRRPLAALTGCAIAALCLTACGASTSITSKPPATVLTLARTAMDKKGSVTFVERVTIGTSISYEVSGRSTAGSAEQLLDLGPGDIGTLRLIGTALYLQADAGFYDRYFKVTHTSLAGHWARIPLTNTFYKGLAAGLNLQSVVSGFTDFTPTKVRGGGSFQGTKAIELFGTPVDSAQSGETSQVVYLAVKSPYVALGAEITGTYEGQSVDSIVQFGQWGTTVPVVAPSSAIVATAKDLS